MESPRTCLHSILSILSFGPEGAKNSSLPAQPTAVTETPAMAELCYQLIYRLAANVETTGPALRYDSEPFVLNFLFFNKQYLRRYIMHYAIMYELYERHRRIILYGLLPDFIQTVFCHSFH